MLYRVYVEHEATTIADDTWRRTKFHRTAEKGEMIWNMQQGWTHWKAVEKTDTSRVFFYRAWCIRIILDYLWFLPLHILQMFSSALSYWHYFVVVRLPNYAECIVSNYHMTNIVG